MTEELVFALENDVPEATYNGPYPVDGVQPTPEEADAILAILEGADEDE